MVMLDGEMQTGGIMRMSINSRLNLWCQSRTRSLLSDQPEGSGSVEQHVEIQFEEQNELQQDQQLHDNVQPAVEENPLAIVPHQPPV